MFCQGKAPRVMKDITETQTFVTSAMDAVVYVIFQPLG
jgi:hypothetical protein